MMGSLQWSAYCGTQANKYIQILYWHSVMLLPNILPADAEIDYTNVSTFRQELRRGDILQDTNCAPADRRTIRVENKINNHEWEVEILYSNANEKVKFDVRINYNYVFIKREFTQQQRWGKNLTFEDSPRWNETLCQILSPTESKFESISIIDYYNFWGTWINTNNFDQTSDGRLNVKLKESIAKEAFQHLPTDSTGNMSKLNTLKNVSQMDLFEACYVSNFNNILVKCIGTDKYIESEHLNNVLNNGNYISENQILQTKMWNRKQFYALLQNEEIPPQVIWQQEREKNSMLCGSKAKQDEIHRQTQILQTKMGKIESLKQIKAKLKSKEAIQMFNDTTGEGYTIGHVVYSDTLIWQHEFIQNKLKYLLWNSTDQIPTSATSKAMMKYSFNSCDLKYWAIRYPFVRSMIATLKDIKECSNIVNRETFS
ncbi:MAG: hypothetical protein ACPG2Y_02865, partial [Acholeplasmataceae bacterium]